MLPLLLSVLVAIAALFLFSRKRARLVRLVDKIPGPPSYPFVGTELPFVLARRNELWAMLQSRLCTYQPMMRTWIGSNAVVHLTRPEHAEILLSSTRHLEKSFAYKFTEPWLGTGLLTSTGQKWHTHRKIITPTFHFSILDNFVDVFSEKSEILVSKLRKEIHSQSFDVFPYITHCALDIICETAMGTPVYAQEDAELSSYVTALYDISELIVRRTARPWVYNDVIYSLTRDGRRHGECLAVLHDFTNKVIQERKERRRRSARTDCGQQEDQDVGKKKRLAFLDMLLDASENGTKLTDVEIREQVDTFMFAGHDTTSAGISWALYLLGLHPDVQSKAYEELQRIFEGSDRPPTMKDLTEMKYLERVIKESLRIYPSAPFFSRLLKEDIEIGGYTIPAGAAVRVHSYRIHRNPVQFPNPEKFDPDNFLPERAAKRHPYAYIPFSAGPRNCIGQKFALLEEKTVLSYILRHYRLHSLDKREDMNELAELILRPENGVRLSIKARRMEAE